MDNGSEQLEHTLSAVGSALDRLVTERDSRLHATKGRFNLFTVLRRAHEETGLHSQYLAHLLDPRASHDCNGLFLKLFLETVGCGVQAHHDETNSEPSNLLASLDAASLEAAKVYTELPAGSVGRLDIVVELDNWGAIVIENKIYAGEQEDQISRYVGHLEAKYKQRNEKYLMLYLTLDGRRSGTAGEYANSYFRISYKGHVVDWLEKCLQATYKHVNINQSLQQYKMLVQQLTGTLPEDYMPQVTSLLKQHPSIIRHLDEMQEAANRIRDEVRRALYSQLNGHLASEGLQPVTDGGSWCITQWGALISLKYDGEQWSGLGVRLVLEHNFGVNLLYIGLSRKKDGDQLGPAVGKEALGTLKSVGDYFCDVRPSDIEPDSEVWWARMQLPCPKLSRGDLAGFVGERGERELEESARKAARSIGEYKGLLDAALRAVSPR